jgi:lipopolysaccharide export system permease protein
LSRFFTATDRYIFRLVLVPMLGIFALAASLLLLEKMLRLFEFVSTEGGPVNVVFEMLLNVIPEYAGLAIPLGLMLGVLFAFRRLAMTSELDVMRAVGQSYLRLLRVPYLLTVVLMGLNFAIVGYMQPKARFAYQELEFQLRSGALGASIKVGEFTAIEDRMACGSRKAARTAASCSGYLPASPMPRGRFCRFRRARAASSPTAKIATPSSCG